MLPGVVILFWTAVVAVEQAAASSPSLLPATLFSVVRVVIIMALNSQNCVCACGLAAVQASNPDVGFLGCLGVSHLLPWQQDISSVPTPETFSALLAYYFGCVGVLKTDSQFDRKTWREIKSLSLLLCLSLSRPSFKVSEASALVYRQVFQSSH